MTETLSSLFALLPLLLMDGDTKDTVELLGGASLLAIGLTSITVLLRDWWKSRRVLEERRRR